MSGLCGWIGHSNSASENLQLARQMAGPLSRFDGCDIKALAGMGSALAVAARDGSSHLYQKDGLMVAIWGRLSFVEPQLAQLALSQGVAKTLADHWRACGGKAFVNLAGTFSFCILNENADEAVLATDRMGTYPVSFQLAGRGLVFGSTADAILMHPLIKPEIASQSLYNYVYFHMVPGPDTIYREQTRLLPGEYLIYRKGRIETQRYWEMQFLEDRKRPFQELKEDFLGVLRSSVCEAAGGEEVGAFLSGGTDSSTIAGTFSSCS